MYQQDIKNDDSNNNSFAMTHSTHWNRSEDKLFEHALVMFPEESPDRWQKIASQLPGKSAVEVREHYEALVHDVYEIDSGRVELPSYADDSDWDSPSQISFVPKSTKHGDPERKKGTPWTEEEHKYDFFEIFYGLSFKFFLLFCLFDNENLLCFCNSIIWITLNF